MKLQAAQSVVGRSCCDLGDGIAGSGVVAARAAGVLEISAGDEPFPDVWFFDGPNGPAPLKSLEGKPAEIEIETWIGDPVSLSKLCAGRWWSSISGRRGAGLHGGGARERRAR